VRLLNYITHHVEKQKTPPGHSPNSPPLAAAVSSVWLKTLNTLL
jgi:hypothetical protein